MPKDKPYIESTEQELKDRLDALYAEIAQEPSQATRQRAYLRRSDRISNLRQAILHARAREARA